MFERLKKLFQKNSASTNPKTDVIQERNFVIIQPAIKVHYENLSKIEEDRFSKFASFRNSNQKFK